MGEVASHSIDEHIYANKEELKNSAGFIATTKFPEYFEGWEDTRWSNYFTKHIYIKVSIVKLNSIIVYK